MKITSVEVTYGQTWQLKQFEPLSLSITVKADIFEGDDFQESIESLQHAAREAVIQQAIPILTRVGRIKSKPTDSNTTFNNNQQ